jgi:hypothetical protein
MAKNEIRETKKALERELGGLSRRGVSYPV